MVSLSAVMLKDMRKSIKTLCWGLLIKIPEFLAVKPCTPTEANKMPKNTVGVVAEFNRAGFEMRYWKEGCAPRRSQPVFV
jgi:hypothetical protein